MDTKNKNNNTSGATRKRTLPDADDTVQMRKKKDAPTVYIVVINEYNRITDKPEAPKVVPCTVWENAVLSPKRLKLAVAIKGMIKDPPAPSDEPMNVRYPFNSF